MTRFRLWHWVVATSLTAAGAAALTIWLTRPPKVSATARPSAGACRVAPRCRNAGEAPAAALSTAPDAVGRSRHRHPRGSVLVAGSSWTPRHTRCILIA
jgi:hypothetical protein